MKFDKETWIVVLIAGVLMVAWFIYYPQYQREQREEQAKIQTAAAEARQRNSVPPAAQPAAAQPAVPSAVPAQPTAAAPAVPAAASVPSTIPEAVRVKGESALTLSNESVEIRLNASTGGIESATLLKYRNANDHEKNVSGLSDGLFQSLQPTIPGIAVTDASVVPASGDPRSAVITLDCTNGLKIVETVSLPEKGYQIQVQYLLTNSSDAPLRLPGMTFWAAGVPPTAYLAGDKIYSERHNIDYCLLTADGKDDKAVNLDPTAKDAKFEKFGTDRPVSWAGSSNKYFASILFVSRLPGNAGMTTVRRQLADPAKKNELYSVPSVGILADVTIPAGGTESCAFSYYFGPKEIAEIRHLPESVMGAMHFSYFSWFEFLARPMVLLLVWLNNHICHSYGIAIILLTILVRLIFWPITQKANNSMRKMQKLQPQMKEIREKYKSNPQEMNVRMMELYRKEKVSPLGGCLPILFQIPVFFALYSALDSAVELRQVGFLWCTDLAKPDLIGPQIDLPFLGPTGLHPLVIAMTVLMVVQQKMTPSAADPMQQKMMMLMPVIMLFMLYNLPSGLTLYWTVSQVFSILQMKYGLIIAKREEEKASSARQP